VRAAEKHLELASVIEPDVTPGIVGDVTRLRQILVNLIGNAVKFTERGSVAVEVAPAAASADATAIRFEIVDTGIGMSAEVCGTLFQKFTQADSSVTRRPSSLPTWIASATSSGVSSR